ncbi:hypothetical protein [Flavobacterium coralii]|uniref:hypothetical protein n=1 Tax=Flavobacterium coralii TaxID=2838017 RepID=UPI000C360058|nr:hypothetical protein [Flavobacterium sp.]|tara:strand:- start:18488 stop:19627 length:1140 start_codon:yes stop_codon:yes gene_type:complete
MIIFTGGIGLTKLRPAYSNDIYTFSTDAGTPLYCDITSQGLSMIRLYPRPDGSFWLNLKPYISAIINTRKFEDNVVTDFQSPNPQSFIYDFTTGTYLNLNLTFTITLDDDSTDSISYVLTWYAGCSQIGDLSPLLNTEFHVLTPSLKSTTNKYYLKYWAGYPFDLSMYYNGDNITLENTTTGYSVDFETFSEVNRIFLSDGRTSETLEDIMPVADGYNTIRIMADGTPSDNDKYIIINKQPITCGVYVKWLNSRGGYSYWLFEDTAKVDRSTRSMGEIENNYSNNESTMARTLNIGMDAQDRIRVTAELLSEDDTAILKDILSSPKIYMFTGEPASQNDYRNWIEVMLVTNSTVVKNHKEKLTNFVLDFRAPMRDTQTL